MSEHDAQTDDFTSEMRRAVEVIVQMAIDQTAQMTDGDVASTIEIVRDQLLVLVQQSVRRGTRPQWRGLRVVDRLKDGHDR